MAGACIVDRYSQRSPRFASCVRSAYSLRTTSHKGIAVKVLLTLALAAAVALPANAGEHEIKKALSEMTNGALQVDTISRSPYGGLYEVYTTNGQLLFTDAAGTFLIEGVLMDLKRRANYTSERLADLGRLGSLSDLPLTQAIKTVRGNGRRTVISFEDPNCGYCKRFVKDAQQLTDVTIYTFLIPILTPDSAEKSKAIWCSKDRAGAWRDWMSAGKLPDADAGCTTPIDANLALSRKLHIAGTPTLFLADGSRLPGYTALDKLDEAINTAEKKAGKAR